MRGCGVAVVWAVSAVGGVSLAPDPHSFAEARGVANIAPFLLAFRALRLAFSSVVTPSSLPHAAFRDDKWQHEGGRKAIAASIHAALDSVVDRDILFAFVEAVMHGVAAEINGTKPPPVDASALGQNGCLLAELPALCVAAVAAGGPMHQDLPFETFVEQHRLCQFMPQQYRIATWAHAVFGDILLERDVPDSFFVPPEGLNLHSPHLLMYFSRHVAAHMRKRSAVREGFVCGVRVSVMTPDEMHLSQAVLKQVP